MTHQRPSVKLLAPAKFFGSTSKSRFQENRKRLNLLAKETNDCQGEAPNIQRITSQNQECNNCHGQAELFLTADDVLPDELEANSAVIVTEIPAGK